MEKSILVQYCVHKKEVVETYKDGNLIHCECEPSCPMVNFCEKIGENVKSWDEQNRKCDLV